MPKTTRTGQVKKDELPGTLQRSEEHAQATFAKTLDAAEEQYGDDERAHRTAYASLKRGYEKVGDHWEPKAHTGPSDAQAEAGAGASLPTAEGVDANASKAHLYALARRLEIPGRSSMDKQELVDALTKENRKRTRNAGKNRGK